MSIPITGFPGYSWTGGKAHEWTIYGPPRNSQIAVIRLWADENETCFSIVIFGLGANITLQRRSLTSALWDTCEAHKQALESEVADRNCPDRHAREDYPEAKP